MLYRAATARNPMSRPSVPELPKYLLRAHMFRVGLGAPALQGSFIPQTDRTYYNSIYVPAAYSTVKL